MTGLIIFLLAVIIASVIAVIVVSLKNISAEPYEPPRMRAGRDGEYEAFGIIKSVMRDDDSLFSNVEIAYDGKQTELDNVIVNRYGVFIIEVKNYVGYIVGEEDDFEWRKYKTTRAGNIYEKNVKNPIKQVKRQIYILAKYLNWYGIDVWVDGYAILLEGNSPVKSRYVLSCVADVDKAIHGNGKKPLPKKTVKTIADLLS